MKAANLVKARGWSKAVALALAILLVSGLGTAVARDEPVGQPCPMYPDDPLMPDGIVEEKGAGIVLSIWYALLERLATLVPARADR